MTYTLFISIYLEGNHLVLPFSYMLFALETPGRALHCQTNNHVQPNKLGIF